ncbi:hypothetical protein [Pseudoalteromonas sp. Of7M-16]|uniref:hypothetical protein n=1 Tax=Pseudoalteromonas sp. Of7M-16 TaxID=2917756 RepID=UPI001EF5A080|nr:hypothetical protein [Pseudoalteromonas sp. Of7M-16]MCG7546955.1 hypothetical protein [Pseudoalteromonas sp. Of7M-16]
MKLTIQPFDSFPLLVTKRWLNIINASHPFRISFENHSGIVGAASRQYDLGEISSIQINNESDTELVIEYDIANINITSAADGNVKVVNSIQVDSIREEVKVLSRSEVGLGLNSLDDTDLSPQESKMVASANINRKELILQNTSVNPVDIRVGGANVGQRNGGLIKAGGSFVLSNGAAVYAFNSDQSHKAKLSVIEVLQ